MNKPAAGAAVCILALAAVAYVTRHPLSIIYKYIYSNIHHTLKSPAATLLLPISAVSCRFPGQSVALPAASTPQPPPPVTGPWSAHASCYLHITCSTKSSTTVCSILRHSTTIRLSTEVWAQCPQAFDMSAMQGMTQTSAISSTGNFQCLLLESLLVMKKWSISMVQVVALALVVV